MMRSMLEIAKILTGGLALFLAWVLFFRTRLIYRFNAWMRDHVFNDNLVLFSGQRLAILLLVLGAIALFSGIEQITNDQDLKPKIAAKIISEARTDFINKDYSKVIERCRALIRSNPRNFQAMELLAASYHALGEKEKANEIIYLIIQQEPTYPISKGPLEKVFGKSKKVIP